MNLRYLSLLLAFTFGMQSSLTLANQPNEFIDGVKVNTSNGVALLIADPNRRNSSFSGNLARRGIEGSITTCTSLIDVPVGTANGNHSFGGLCTLATNGIDVRVMICDDDMLGHFEITKTRSNVKMQELIDFVVSNCYGG